MPVAMALLRDVHNLCPKEVLTFILDLIKYNDNRKNKVRYLNIIKLASDLFIYLFCFLVPYIRRFPGLHHSHSSVSSEVHLQPTAQLTATPDP